MITWFLLNQRSLHPVAIEFICRLAVILLALSGPAPLAHGQNFANRAGDPVAMNKLFLEPTKPVNLQGIFEEWDVQDSLYVAIPGVMNRGEDAKRLTYFKDLIKATVPVLPVTIVINSEERPFGTYLIEDYLPRFLSLEEMERITLFPTQNNNCWIRDYAPQYALDPKNGVVMLDPRYGKSLSDFLQVEIVRHSGSETEDRFDASLDAYATNTMSWADTFPSKLAHRLRGKTFRPIKVVRPPVYLEGGDFTSDGQGNVFLSLKTLHINGGDADALRRTVRRYYGVGSVHFLRELPGEMICHLDYVIKFTGPGVALIAQDFPESFDKGFRGQLAEEIKEALAFNNVAKSS